MDHSDEQLRHLLNFKNSSHLSQLHMRGEETCVLRTKISSPPHQLTDLALAPLHLELAEPKPGAILQCTVH